jgi:hypothetical protein
MCPNMPNILVAELYMLLANKWGVQIYKKYILWGLSHLFACHNRNPGMTRRLGEEEGLVGSRPHGKQALEESAWRRGLL